MKSLALASCVLALVGAAAASASTAPGKAGVIAAVEAQERYFNARAWKALWATYSPRFHARCRYGGWLAGIKADRAALGRVAYKVVRVRFAGPNKAYVDNRASAASGASTTFANDLYVRIKGRWYDELDSSTRCGT